jgi:plasmid stabilization system protein ParE
MAYAVNLTARAERDLAALYDEIHASGSQTARRWYRGLKKQILSLEKIPFRCAVTPENKNLRHLLCGHGRNIYRIIYLSHYLSGMAMQVDVFHIRHGARNRFK